MPHAPLMQPLDREIAYDLGHRAPALEKDGRRTAAGGVSSNEEGRGVLAPKRVDERGEAVKIRGDLRHRYLRVVKGGRSAATTDAYWRKGWDSNPRYPCRYAGFQDRCLKPLGHPSYV